MTDIIDQRAVDLWQAMRRDIDRNKRRRRLSDRVAVPARGMAASPDADRLAVPAVAMVADPVANRAVDPGVHRRGGRRLPPMPRVMPLLRGAMVSVLLPLAAALILAACDIPGHSHAGWPPGL